MESQAQNSVGIGTTDPNPHAVLELKSDHQGFLVPSLTSAQRNQMAGILGGSSENNGLIVFDTDTGKFYYWLDGKWIKGLGSFSGPASGDLSGNFPNPRVSGLQGNPVSSDTPGNKQILQWDGNAWKPVDNYNAGAGISISGNRIINTGDTDPGDDVLITDEAGGDVSGTFDNLQLLAGSVGSSEISDESITTGKIKDEAVTLQKINTGPNDAILITDDSGNPVWEDQAAFVNDKTNRHGVLLGDGTDILGVQGTAANQVLKWDETASGWTLAQDDDRQDLSDVLGEGNSAGDRVIEDLGDPVNAQDAATKNYVDGIDTDDADADPENELQDLSLAGNTLSLSDDETTVDLSGYLDNTDDQDLSDVLGQGSSAGNQGIQDLADPVDAQDAATKNYVDGIDTDDADADPENELQDLSLAGNTLSLSDDETTVDLSGYLDNTDDQQLTLSADLLSIEDGNTVDLSPYMDNTDEQDLSDVLGQGNSAGGQVIEDLADPVNAQDAATKNYVDGIDTDDADADPENELQDLSLAGNTLSLSDDETTVDLSGYLDNTDDQTLSLVDDALSIEGGNTVDLSPYMDNTDEQDLSDVLGEGNSAGGQVIGDLADPVDAQDAATKNYVDGIDTDDADADPENELQDLSLAGNILSLSDDETTVDLSGYLDNTDDQTLSLVDDALSIEGGNTVDLSAYMDNTDEQDLSDVLGEGNDAGGLAISNIADPAAAQDAATKNYVDGLHAADGDKDAGNELITAAVLVDSALVITEGGVNTIIEGVGDIISVNTFNGSGITGGAVQGSPNLSLVNKSDGQILVGDGGTKVNAVNVSGAITLDKAGVTTLQNNVVSASHIADQSITSDKLAQSGAISGETLVWDGTAWVASDASAILASGDITEIQAGTGLAGGGDTGSVALSLVNTGDGEILVGDDGKVNAVNVSGAITLDKAGVTTLQNNVVSASHIADHSITSDKLAQSGAVSGETLVWDGTAWVASDASAILGSGDITEVQAGSGLAGGGDTGSVALSLVNTGDGEILVGDGSGVNVVTMGGDIALDSDGTATIGNNAVTTEMILNNTIKGEDLENSAITGAKIADAAVTTQKIANGSVSDSKIVSMAYSKLQQGSAGTNDVLQWDGSQWRATALASGVTATATRYQSIGPVSFERTGEDLKANISYPNDAAHATMESGGLGVAIAPLFLPDRAVIEEVTVYLYDKIGDDISASLEIKPLNGSAGTKISLGTTSGAPGMTQVANPVGQTVDNSRFIYRIVVEAKPDEDHRIYGARIKFTETSVDIDVPNGSRMGGGLNVGSEPADPQPGMLWLKTNSDAKEVIYEYDGTQWNVIADDDNGIL